MRIRIRFQTPLAVVASWSTRKLAIAAFTGGVLLGGFTSALIVEVGNIQNPEAASRTAPRNPQAKPVQEQATAAPAAVQPATPPASAEVLPEPAAIPPPRQKKASAPPKPAPASSASDAAASDPAVPDAENPHLDDPKKADDPKKEVADLRTYRLRSEGPFVVLADEASTVDDLHSKPGSLSELIQRGTLFTVKPDTGAEILEKQGKLVKVKVTEGDKSGRSGWIEARQLKPSNR
jgi:hypothetical protein